MPLLPIVPELVSDTTLKRARTTTGGGEEAIRVASTIDPSNLDPVTNSLGKTDDAAWDGSDPDATVISLLKGIVNKLN